MTVIACPICKRPPERAYAPFCSKRCADIDLQRWFSGAYAIPAEDDDADPNADGDGLPGQPGRGPL